MPMSINRSFSDPTVLMPGDGKNLSIMGMTIVIKTTSRQTDTQFSTIEITEPPGAGSPLQYNQVMAMACYVLEGTLALQVGDRTQDLGPGSYAYLPAGTVYQTVNHSNAPAKYLLFSIPGGLDEYIVELIQLAQSEPSGPPDDMSWLIALRTKYHFYDAPTG